MLGSFDVITFIPTRNPAASRAFYEGVLGLKFVEEDPFATVMDCNGIAMRIVSVGDDFKPANFTVLGWAVDDIKEAVTSLTNKGVVFDIYDGFGQDDLGIWTAPDGAQVAWFKDPDGNVLSVSKDTE